MFIKKLESSTQTIKIGVVGKYTQLLDAYKSLISALHHAAILMKLKLI